MIKQQKKGVRVEPWAEHAHLSTHWNTWLLWGGTEPGKHRGSFSAAWDLRGTGAGQGCWGAGRACPSTPSLLGCMGCSACWVSIRCLPPPSLPSSTGPCQPFSPCEVHSLALPPPQLQRGQGGDTRERAGWAEIGGSMKKDRKSILRKVTCRVAEGIFTLNPLRSAFL